MTSDARNALPTFEVCFQNWLDSQTDSDLREALCEELGVHFIDSVQKELLWRRSARISDP